MSVNCIYLDGTRYAIENFTPKRYRANTKVTVNNYDCDVSANANQVRFSLNQYNGTEMPAGSEIDVLSQIGEVPGTVVGYHIKYYHLQYQSWWDRYTDAAGYQKILDNSTYIGDVENGGGS